MKRIVSVFVLAFVVLPTFADWDDIECDGTFRMTINSIKDDEFEVDKDGVWLLNSEIIATIHLNPDSIKIIQFWEEGDVFPSMVLFTGKGIIENYGDSVKLKLPLWTEFGCDEVIRTVIVLRILDADGSVLKWKSLLAEDFKIIDNVKNPECIAAYEAYNRTVGIDGLDADAAEDDEGAGKKGDMYFDLSGRRLAGPPAKGICIRNGKKILVK